MGAATKNNIGAPSLQQTPERVLVPWHLLFFCGLSTYCLQRRMKATAVMAGQEMMMMEPLD